MLGILDLASGSEQLMEFSRDATPLRYPVENGYFVIRNLQGVSNVWLYSPEMKPVKAITDFKFDSIFDFDVSRDGKQLAMVRGQGSTDVVLVRIGR